MARVLSHLPQRTAAPKELEVRPKPSIAWIAGLPLAQPLESARKLASHTEALNSVKLDADDRIQILEAAGPTAAVLLEEMEAIYSKSTLPHGSRAREAITVSRALSTALSVGYRIAAADKSAKLLGFGSKKQVPLLLHRAMHYLFAGLKASYKSYTQVSPGTWRDLHDLYLFAEAQEAARIADDEGKSTLLDLYSEALLLALTDPYRLAPGECDKVLAQARSLRGLVTLAQARPATPTGGHFLVPCDTDKPPKPALSAHDETGGPHWRLLDANALVDKLRVKKNAVESGNVSATMRSTMGPDGLALLRKLITLWGDPPKRAHRRVPSDDTVALCVGLKAVMHFLAFERQMDPEIQAKALKEGITLPMMALPTDDGAQSIPVFEWRIVNQSDGGLKLRRDAATPQPLAVGEVVALKFAARPRWTIGVLRWVTAFDDGSMEFGVQYLAQSARGTWVQASNASTPQAKPGLLLDGEEPGDALVAPPGTFSELREYELVCGGQTLAVRSNGLIEKTNRFELFSVAPLIA